MSKKIEILKIPRPLFLDIPYHELEVGDAFRIDHDFLCARGEDHVIREGRKQGLAIVCATKSDHSLFYVFARNSGKRGVQSRDRVRQEKILNYISANKGACVKEIYQAVGGLSVATLKRELQIMEVEQLIFKRTASKGAKKGRPGAIYETFSQSSLIDATSIQDDHIIFPLRDHGEMTFKQLTTYLPQFSENVVKSRLFDLVDAEIVLSEGDTYRLKSPLAH